MQLQVGWNNQHLDLHVLEAPFLSVRTYIIIMYVVWPRISAIWEPVREEPENAVKNKSGHLFMTDS